MGGGVVCRGDDSTTLKLNDTRLRVKRVKLFLGFNLYKIQITLPESPPLFILVVIGRSNEFNGHQEFSVMIGRSTKRKETKNWVLTINMKGSTRTGHNYPNW